ncbi:MAG: ATP/GTP-binding protein [Dehalococcoidia bacterium]|nr:ATP/GTP-binding protein [Dehalococcoidia bacterium]
MRTPKPTGLFSMDDTVSRLLEGDQRALSRLISLVESGDPRDARIMEEVHPYTGTAYCIGVTGPPGVGKSTIVDRLTEAMRARGLTVGIIAVDPTSPYSGGAFLGDRVRMQRHYLDPGVFIRSMATRDAAGGLPRVVLRAVRLLGASGKELVVVEAGGVGQHGGGGYGGGGAHARGRGRNPDPEGRPDGDRRRLRREQGRQGGGGQNGGRREVDAGDGRRAWELGAPSGLHPGTQERGHRPSARPPHGPQGVPGQYIQAGRQETETEGGGVSGNNRGGAWTQAKATHHQRPGHEPCSAEGGRGADGTLLGGGEPSGWRAGHLQRAAARRPWPGLGRDRRDHPPIAPGLSQAFYIQQKTGKKGPASSRYQTPGSDPAGEESCLSWALT